MKKNFFSSHRGLLFRPATLEKWKEGDKEKWRIVFYQTSTEGVLTRHRPTFDLNRSRIIKSNYRQTMADELIRQINLVLPFGYPHKVDLQGNQVSKNQNKMPDLGFTPIVEALEFVKDLLMSTLGEESKRTYSSILRLFIQFLEVSGMNDCRVADLSRKHAVAYMDNCLVKRKIGAQTYNNTLTILNRFFNLLVEREYISENPFAGIKSRKVSPKRRKRFTPKDRDTVANYIEENHPWFFYAILLQYYCLIRPIELTRLRFSHFDLGKQVIEMPGEITKNGKARSPTIPDSILPYFLKKEFTEWPINYMVFGKGIKPGTAKDYHAKTYRLRRKQMYERHKKVLIKLTKEGLIEDMTGYQWYTWSDTGADDRKREGLPVQDISDQKGHSSVTITEMYFHKDLNAIPSLKRVPNVFKGQ
ncbi:MAG: phage integrase N-terminal SAM-like domain-containing protein [Bacteroidetes bacterium]|nr:phage integrase N-terminal SAM-like domain-containing protein [Bacteroidota bacterium]